MRPLALRITDRAEDDLAEIWSFIAEASPETASEFVRRIEDTFEPLRQHPELGPRRDTLAPGLRVHFYRDYAIYYRPTETAIVIVRVMHGARDAAAAFSEQQDHSGTK
ncbi:MAG: type II toxin-antitoxin system RelE/ParE family toxin [Rhodospirillales bacterium]|nr:type II toxin-antitoxin system RelE/ParE family toxin [Rhodospirillales bacterium]